MIFLSRLAIVSLLCEAAFGWSSSSSNVSPRRQFLDQTALAVAAAFSSPKLAQAACLPGDLSPECIGVYKLPVDAARSSGTLNTKRALESNAPDVNYVPPVAIPKTIQQARQVLEAQRAAADDIQAVILAGKLEEAGIKVLNLIPKITTAGNALREEVQQKYSGNSGVNQMRVSKFEESLQELIVAWSQLDVEIGQAIRGQLGMTVAQITMLKSIKDAIIAFDDFLSAVDKSL